MEHCRLVIPLSDLVRTPEPVSERSLMKRVAVLGGGPAGAFAAEQLASAGLKVQLFDEKLAWEKPCGGGLTYKAYSQYPFLVENSTPKRFIRETVLAAPKAGEVSMQLDVPLVIYSRFDLNRLLLERAEHAGAAIEKARILELSRAGAGWRLRTSSGTAEADFCVVATGARNPLREVGTELHPQDTMSALGYYVPGDQAKIDIQFLPGLEGYIWVFPRREPSLRGNLRKGRAGPVAARAPGTLYGGNGIDYKGAALLWPPASVAGDSRLEKQSRGGRRLDGGGGRGWTGGSDHRRGLVLRDAVRRPGESGVAE